MACKLFAARVLQGARFRTIQIWPKDLARTARQNPTRDIAARRRARGRELS